MEVKPKSPATERTDAIIDALAASSEKALATARKPDMKAAPAMKVKAAAKPMKAMKALKAMKAMKAKPMKAKAKATTDKPKAWLKKRPHGCSKCRYVPGCTLSCWKLKGGHPQV